LKQIKDPDPLAPYRDRREQQCSTCEHKNVPTLQKQAICRTCIVKDSYNEDLTIAPEESF
jgi:hypothetical protein